MYIILKILNSNNNWLTYVKAVKFKDVLWCVELIYNIKKLLILWNLCFQEKSNFYGCWNITLIILYNTYQLKWNK